MHLEIVHRGDNRERLGDRRLRAVVDDLKKPLFRNAQCTREFTYDLEPDPASLGFNEPDCGKRNFSTFSKEFLTPFARFT